MSKSRSVFIRILKILGWTVFVLLILFLLFLWRIWMKPPEVNSAVTPASLHRVLVAKDSYKVGNNWLKKNKQGIWEMYIEGNDYERGVAYGVLSKELMEIQEDYFVNELKAIVPGRIYRDFLKFFIGWFNRDIDKYIPEENLREIYGISLSFSPKYNFIAEPYQRILNYHAAHDIGHALNDFQLVGCTSFAVNQLYSSDSSLLIGRNFDFYLGDDFAKNKLIVFVNPEHGYKFATYSWAGFTGVVSGMNAEGLTVTINASKSDVPFEAKDPISLLAREVLQYAKNIDEAVAIAKKRETFVSETLMIGSANDNKAVLIEKSPKKLDVYSTDNGLLICANHYQGDDFKTDKENVDNINNSDSKSRYDRMNTLLNENLPVDYKRAAEVLRNKEGVNDSNVGYGNPKSINQLIAHHGVVFKPSKKQMWVSSVPYQEGEFVYYNLDSVFKNGAEYHNDSMNISADEFLKTSDYAKYEAYKITKQKIAKFTKFGVALTLTAEEVKQFIDNNPKSYITYMALGNYFKEKKDYARAAASYQQSLKCDVASLQERTAIEESLKQCMKKLKE